MNSNCSVVVADDSHESADTLVALLRAMGCSATAAYDGREAVEACRALIPAVVILDIEMPFLNGCAAARIIRAGAHPPRLIASLSAQRHWDEPMKSEGGAFDVRLSKPARIEQLRELLARATARDPDASTARPGSDPAQAIIVATHRSDAVEEPEPDPQRGRMS